MPKVTVRFYGGYKYKSPSKRRWDRPRKEKFLAKFKRDPVLMPIPFLEPGQSPSPVALGEPVHPATTTAFTTQAEELVVEIKRLYQRCNYIPVILLGVSLGILRVNRIWGAICLILTICLVLGKAMAQQPNICKIAQSSLYSWTMYIIKEIRCCHHMLNFPGTKLCQGFHFLFLNSAILYSCILVSAVYIYQYLPFILGIHQLFLLDCVGFYL